MAGSSFTYVFPVYRRPQQPISQLDPITACLVVQARTILLYFSGQLARTSRAWSACLSRIAFAVYRGLDFIISKWASYFICRSLICNPLMGLRSHSSKVASLHHQPKVHFMAASG
jgi:hypothetical protein